MWMPGYVAPEDKDDWKTQQSVLRAAHARRRIPTPEERQAKKQIVKDRAAKTKRAQDAEARGASREEIKRIMES